MKYYNMHILKVNVFQIFHFFLSTTCMIAHCAIDTLGSQKECLIKRTFIKRTIRFIKVGSFTP